MRGEKLHGMHRRRSPVAQRVLFVYFQFGEFASLYWFELKKLIYSVFIPAVYFLVVALCAPAYFTHALQ